MYDLFSFKHTCIRPMQFICNFQMKDLINSPYYRQKHKLAGLCNGQAHCELGIENLITLGVCFQKDGGGRVDSWPTRI